MAGDSEIILHSSRKLKINMLGSVQADPSRIVILL